MKESVEKSARIAARSAKYLGTLILTGLSLGVAFGWLSIDKTPLNVAFVISLITFTVVGAVANAFFSALAASQWVSASAKIQRINQAYPAATLLDRVQKAAFATVLLGALLAEYLMLMSLT